MIFFNLKRGLEFGMSDETQLDLLDFICSYTIHHALVPGKVETYNFVVDLDGLSMMEAPIYILKELSSRLKRGYKVRVHNVIVVNIDWRIEYGLSFM